MTDKEQIKAIIKQYADKGERLYNESCETKDDSQTIGYWDGYKDCANLLLRELDDMQEESKKCMYSKDNYTDEDKKVLCEGCEEECEFNKKEEPVSEDLEEAALLHLSKHYDTSIIWDEDEKCVVRDFKAGANWKEQQLLAKAVDIEVKVDAGGYPYIPQIELYDYREDIPLAKEGDKYKVILIKED